MLTRQTILKTVVLFFALLWVVDADAAIYKWKDENAKIYFTDDITFSSSSLLNEHFGVFPS